MNDIEPKLSRILHISDLHFRYRFQQLKWTKLLEKARELEPDLVMITGDLVNTPWRWMLRRGSTRLDELDQWLAQSAEDKARREIWVIPGNHDTRITGLVPVGWLIYVALMCAAIGGLFWILGIIQPPLPSWAHAATRTIAYGFFSIAIVAGVLRLCVGRDLKGYFGDNYLSEARISKRIPIGIVPFDSASEGVSWARGRVSNDSFSKFTTRLPTEPHGRTVCWIAAVHHHPLPLPYDNQAEPMMAMDNAGEFLSQLSKRGVPLVLHGHIHHQNFSRINIGSGNSKR